MPLRTRIYLRELYGREPTEIEVEDQSQIVKSETSEPIDEQLRQIQDAYSVGHEVLLFIDHRSPILMSPSCRKFTSGASNV